MKRSLKFEKKTLKSARKLRVNEISGQNILEINEGKKIPVRNAWRQRKRCNSMIRTMREDQAWWDKQYGNLIPSPWYE